MIDLGSFCSLNWGHSNKFSDDDVMTEKFDYGRPALFSAPFIQSKCMLASRDLENEMVACSVNWLLNLGDFFV